MTPFHCIILCSRKNPSLHVRMLCIGIFAFKMTTEIICLQDELPIVLITTLDLETFIKGHHVYKDIWTQKQGEQLDEFKWTNSQYVWILMKKLLNRLMTQALGQKLLVKGVILAMERECKSLANSVYLESQNLYLSHVNN